ncbi:unnamed protein product [Fusarium venenatum]|uniref:Uncharacterized protein n=1 Tax=Fusarium venenatum TaxID=56646 RepID=A0A2L2TL79_9HYPO|nr:uncharacterized protein FVRRES_11025 [Fusarium venenatum]CEI70948.1 unnamed protein product [Fusarium venenatum]
MPQSTTTTSYTQSTVPVPIRVVTGYNTRTCLHARHIKRQLQRREYGKASELDHHYYHTFDRVSIALTHVFPTTIRSSKPHPFPFVLAPFTAHFFRNLEDYK